MLRGAGLEFTAIPADLDEPRLIKSLQKAKTSPADIAETLAQEKARHVSRKMPDTYVIGSDQVLTFEGMLLGKADTEDAAIDRLRQMSGRCHDLISGVSVVKNANVLWSTHDTARLYMHQFTSDFLHAYKAQAGAALTQSTGGYWLEDLGSHLFQAIEGDYFTILGLPLLPLLTYLRTQHGISPLA